ncbi:MAG: hypothetical protein IJJ41_09785 [Clostridia bacterium]|nr:hypothetical protein [Clostridia bacterium]
MKKTILCVVACLLACLLVATCFAGCSKSGDSGETTTAATDTSAATTAAVTQPEGELGGKLEDGTYKMVGVYDMDGKESESGLNILKKLEEKGINIDLVVNGEKIQMNGNDYSLKDGKLVGEDNTLSYAVNGNQVTVFDESDNSKMVYEK